jgi:hypothetical protein
MTDEYSEKTSHIVWHVRSCPLIIPAKKNYQMQKAGAVAERVVYVCFGAHRGLSAVLFFVLKQGMSLWVKRVTLNVPRSLPVYRDKQTFSGVVDMSQTCQNRTSQGVLIPPA